MQLRKLFLYAFTLTLGIGTGFIAVAWTGPTGTAPNNNVGAPLNVGGAGQSKTGGLELNTGGATNGLIVHGTSANKQLVVSTPSGYTNPADFVTGGIQVGLSRPVDGVVTEGIFTYDSAGGAANNIVMGSRSDIVFTTGLGGLGQQPERMRIAGNGNVGIGTANPGWPLEIALSSSNPGISLHYTGAAAAGNKGWIMFTHNRASDGTQEELGYIQGVAENNQSAGGMRFVARTGTDVEAMRILSTGEVAIGTTNPYPSAKFVLDNGTSNTWSEMINYFNGSPQGAYGLYVAGSSYALIANGPVVSYGSVTAPAFYYSSDARLKKNIQSIASSTALAKILALNPVTFNWIDPKSATTTQLGFIAQEVERVVPELVTTDASTTMKAVDYARVTPLLVGAVQAQQAQIEAQQKEIDELKAEVEALKAAK